MCVLFSYLCRVDVCQIHVQSIETYRNTAKVRASSGANESVHLLLRKENGVLNKAHTMFFLQTIALCCLYAILAKHVQMK